MDKFLERLRLARRGAAFTLIELLVVISIVSLLLALVVPVTSGVAKANQISMGIQTVVDELSLARQTALARNRVVEVRFYQYKDSERLADSDEIAAVQSFVYDETNTIAKPLGEIKHLPAGAVISQDSEFSSLMADGRKKTNWNASNDPKVVLPRGIGTDYETYGLRYRPDGATDLGAGSWFLTIHGANEEGEPPPNHAAIQIDPYNGSLRLYRPG